MGKKVQTNLSGKTDKELHTHLKTLVQQERELITEILHHLKEVQKRHLYSDFKYSSLWEYCTRALGYSDSEAHVRISAMRLMIEIPKIEQDLEAGHLSLSNVAKAQSFFRKEQKVLKQKISSQVKAKVIESLKGQSTREAQKILTLKSQTPHIHKESIRRVAEDRLELKFSLNSLVQNKLLQLKSRWAHKDLATQEAFFEKLLDIALEKTAVKAPKEISLKKAVELLSSRPLRAHQVKSRHIPSAIRRYVLKRDEEKCVRCGSEHALQLDHKTPYRQTANHKPENLQVLCRSCNLRKEISVNF